MTYATLLTRSLGTGMQETLLASEPGSICVLPFLLDHGRGRHEITLIGSRPSSKQISCFHIDAAYDFNGLRGKTGLLATRDISAAIMDSLRKIGVREDVIGAYASDCALLKDPTPLQPDCIRPLKIIRGHHPI